MRRAARRARPGGAGARREARRRRAGARAGGRRDPGGAGPPRRAGREDRELPNDAGAAAPAARVGAGREGGVHVDGGARSRAFGARQRRSGVHALGGRRRRSGAQSGRGGARARAGGARAGCRRSGGERSDAGPLRAHPPRQGAARAVRAARRILRQLLHGGPDAAPRADPAGRHHRGVRSLRCALVRERMIPARWALTAPADPAATRALAAELHIPEPLAAILVQRGLASPALAKAFLRPDLESLSDPLRWADMGVAVGILTRAVRDARPIVVHGDYDVDGQCAAALLTRVLRAAGATVHPFVPHRLRDGYDFGPAGLAEAQRVGAGVIVTCDCGITAVESVAAARAAGIEVIVTDHHLPGDALPPASAVLDPRRPDCPSEDKDLCGTGVAFKLAQALVRTLRLSENLPLHFLDYVALATVADVVPLTGENRILVRHGLKMLADSRWVGLRALVETAGLGGKPLRAGHVGFILAPRLNAAGRIADAKDGLRLLLTEDPTEAAALARELETLNARRQELDQKILDEAIELADKTLREDDRALVLAADDWHPGVIGIVASRLVERYGRPTFLIAWEKDSEVGRGSGRSIAGFDLHDALHRTAPHLEKYGGHTMAAGLTVRRERYDAFRVAFLEVAGQLLGPDDLAPSQRVDLELPLGLVNGELERLIRHLEPCGAGNPAPVFGVRGARAVGARRVGTNHLRFTLDDESGALPAIAFQWADAIPDQWLAERLDVAFRLERDEWQGRTTLQARVAAMAPSA